MAETSSSSSFATEDKKRLLLMTHKFTDGSTMHGLRNLFGKDISISRRLTWLMVILGGMAYCFYVIHESLVAYQSLPVLTRTRRKFETNSEFPAVTICSYNMFQRSKLTVEELMAVAATYHIDFYPLATPSVNLSKFDDMDMVEFFKRVATNSTFDSCSYRGRPCDKRLFSQTVADLGLCETFDPSKAPGNAHQLFPGQSGGLSMGQFEHPNEWTMGPYHYYAGFRFVVHKAGTVPHNLINNGMSLIPGKATDAVITRKEVTLLPQPYGQCGSSRLAYYNDYTRENCLFECETNHTVALCGCKYVHMAGTAPICNLRQTRDCRQLLDSNMLDEQGAELLNEAKCSCPQECSHTEYEISVTHTVPSQQFLFLYKNATGKDISKAVRFRLFYQSLEYTEAMEEAVYSFEKFMCDVGGAGGLFLGCSFATIFEFTEFIFDVAWVCWSQKRMRKKLKQQILDDE